MTDALYITVDSAALSDALERRLKTALEDRCGSSAKARLTLRSEHGFVSIEPFLGSASFAALVHRM